VNGARALESSVVHRYRIAGIADVPAGEGREFVIAGRIVALFNSDGMFHAMDGICPHAGGPLAKGELHQNVVTCPWHGWQFDVTTGRHCLNEQLRHATFPVSIEGTDVWVELPQVPV
jgi:nitrite reductase (NADH) small subunit